MRAIARLFAIAAAAAVWLPRAAGAVPPHEPGGDSASEPAAFADDFTGGWDSAWKFLTAPLPCCCCFDGRFQARDGALYAEAEPGDRWVGAFVSGFSCRDCALELRVRLPSALEGYPGEIPWTAVRLRFRGTFGWEKLPGFPSEGWLDVDIKPDNGGRVEVRESVPGGRKAWIGTWSHPVPLDRWLWFRISLQGHSVFVSSRSDETSPWKPILAYEELNPDLQHLEPGPFEIMVGSSDTSPSCALIDDLSLVELGSGPVPGNLWEVIKAPHGK
jgi:hypothetical protein